MFLQSPPLRETFRPAGNPQTRFRTQGQPCMITGMMPEIQGLRIPYGRHIDELLS
jgi:hypothetical protein